VTLVKSAKSESAGENAQLFEVSAMQDGVRLI